MKKLSLCIIVLSCFLVSIPTYSAKKTKNNRQVLWYKEPATDWMNSALPIGNGRIGAMVFGGVVKEEIQFNDKTLWAGTKFNEKSLWRGDEVEIGAYQNFGSVRINFNDQENYTDYRRELDIDKAISKVEYSSGGVKYSREYFASNPDEAIVVQLDANKKGKISFELYIDGAHPNEEKITIGNNKINIDGALKQIEYKAQLSISTNGGTIKTEGKKLIVTGANSATVILTAGTNYDAITPDYTSKNSHMYNVVKANESAQIKGYKELKGDHIKDYSSLYGRVHLSVNEKMPSVPTNELFKNYTDGKYDGAADILYFQYGRYLKISCSRAGLDVPSNLQGLWNHSNTPPWESDYHSNINVQMNYWHAESTNLAECHEPFINYIYNQSQIQPAWQEMARAQNVRGWTMKTQNNLFGASAWMWNRPANAWYCLHIWDKYLFGLDNDYLKNKAYPVMKSASEFWMDRMIVGDDGRFVAPNEWSPEHGPVENGIAYAQQLVWELLDNTIKAADILGNNDEFVKELKRIHARTDNGLAIGNWGQLREWKVAQDDPKDEHRHVSHLIGLYPGAMFGPNKFVKGKDYAAAARKSLLARGDGGTGWSRAWKISFWARLHDGDHAHLLLKNAMNLVKFQGVNYKGGGGVYENLLDAHPPFQIDGNFGASAGIAEMLLQSQFGELHLLPALPQVWSSGEVTGLRGRGAFEVDMKWASMQIKTVTVKSNKGKDCTVRTTLPMKVEGTDYESKQNQDGSYLITFPTKEKGIYILTQI